MVSREILGLITNVSNNVRVQGLVTNVANVNVTNDSITKMWYKPRSVVIMSYINECFLVSFNGQISMYMNEFSNCNDMV